MIMMNRIKVPALYISILVMLGCASPKMADIASTAEPRNEISKLDSEIKVSITKNIDILAADKFEKSQTYLKKAQNDLKNDRSQKEVLDSVRIAKAFLADAYVEAGTRESQAEGLFAARQMALKAGVGSVMELRDDMRKLDSSVSDKADSLANTNAADLADFQNQYIDLERRAVIALQLGESQALVNGAETNDALKLAPISFKKAQLSLKTAESIVSTNVRNPDGFKAAVQKASQDANQLTNVMATISQNGKNLAEATAIKMVAQNKTIKGLQKNLVDVTVKSGAEQTALQMENTQLAMANEASNEKLTGANQKVQFQKALEQARSQFLPSEAEAYQQGETLVIRLKQMNFASGKSDLPANSMPLLAKVLDVAKTLETSQIVVEGHTDSIGSESENKTISEGRASAVMAYLKANGLQDVQIEADGLGFSKPIATNKSKEGRAQNRRVDIILTPNTVQQ